MNTEYIKCSLCGADKTKYLFSSKDNIYGLKGFFDLVKCRKCGLVYTNPRPTREYISMAYPGEYYAFHEDSANPSDFFNPFVSRKKEEVLKVWAEARKSSLKKITYLPYYTMLKEFDHTFIPIKGKCKVLDVGCGVGINLLNWRKQGWIVSGVEINKSAAGYAREKNGLEVFNGTLEESRFQKNSFDLITMFHLLEHTLNPKDALEKARELLKDEGTLIVVTPNFDSLESKLFGKDWLHIDAPRHFYHFTPKTLKRMVEESGFKIEKIKYNVSPHSLLDGIDLYFKIKKIPLKANNSFFAFLLIPFYWLLSLFRCGGIMALHAKKK